MAQTAEAALREIRRDFTFLLAALAVAFAAVTLLLWPLGRLPLALSLVKGFGVFYLTVWVIFLLTVMVMRWFRIDDDSRFDAYLLGNLAAGAVPLLGWTAFAALTVRGAAADAALPAAALLWLVGLFTCWLGYGVVATYYSGSFYKTINLPLAAAGFLLFGAWPAAGRVLFGWFFRLWGA